MKFTHQITCLGVLLAAATLTYAVEVTATPQSNNNQIETRLSRLTQVMKETGIETFIDNNDDSLLARGWGNGRRGSWVNGRRGGFADRRGGGGFLNRRPWRDGGRFYNRSPWRNGGGFWNRY